MVNMEKEFVCASVELNEFEHARKVVVVASSIQKMFCDDRVHSVF